MPHVHAAYDLLGDGKSVLKGGFGRFANLRDISPELTRISRNNAQSTTWTWRDLNGNRAYDKGEVNLDPNGADFRSIAGATNAVVNPNEPQPKSDEWSLTFEREVMRNWAVWATGVYATNFDLRRLAEPLRPRSAYNIAITNPHPGNDGVPRTADDPQGRTITYYEYPTSLNGVAYAGTMIVPATGKQTFKTIEVAGARRISGGWQAAASFSATKSNVPFLDEQADNPNSEINTANQTWEMTSKFSGGYTLPYRRHHVGDLRAPQRRGAGAERAVQRRPDDYANRAQHRPHRHHQASLDEPVEHAFCENGCVWGREAAWKRGSISSISSTPTSSRRGARGWALPT